MHLQDELEAALWDMLAAFANTFMTSEHLSSSSLDVRIDAVLLAADSLLAARWRDDNGPDDANTLSRFRVVSDQRGSKGIPLVSDQRTCCSTRLPPYSIYCPPYYICNSTCYSYNRSATGTRTADTGQRPVLSLTAPYVGQRPT